ncbi:hypothetical protein DSQ76_21240 [Salmonella enterica subsp. enterica serovar Kaolack]|nr:hypothetical protein [Salmonella enterica subsp. enterica serovar Kaolack]
MCYTIYVNALNFFSFLLDTVFSYTLSVYSCHTSVLQKCYIHPVVIFILIHSFFYTICRKVSV